MLKITSRQARDHAIAQVDEHASELFKNRADAIVRHLARSGVEFTTDDVWSKMTGIFTSEPRALGAVMTRLAKAGIIEKTGIYVASSRVECHARPIPVWVGTVASKEIL